MKNFWQKLEKRFLVMAPLDDVTDAAFRRLVARYGKPTVMFTEFTSADGLVRADEAGKQKLLRKLQFDKSERPIVAQLFSSTPEYMEAGAKLAVGLGFDGVDINMGCPVATVEKQGCGAALIKNPARAKEVIQAAKRAVDGKVPVSVKTRIGYKEDELETWVPALLEEDIAALTIHARTRKEMSKVPAKWDRVKRAVEIRDEIRKSTLIIGNGDVWNVEEAHARAAESGVDGVMIGRGVIGNPWVFTGHVPSKKERIDAAREHLELFDRVFEGTGHFPPMKKHLSKYIIDFDGAKELRMKLMSVKSTQEALEHLKSGDYSAERDENNGA